MTNDKMARAYGRRMVEILREAETALGGRSWGLAIRRSQEAVELALKAGLRFVGVEAPKWHDVGRVIQAERNRFPERFQAHVERFVRYSKELGKNRELAFYGDEGAGREPDELFTEAEAAERVGWAREVVSAVQVLIGRPA